MLGGTPVPSNSASIARNPGAQWYLPNQDEWYKAAYHDPRLTSEGGPAGDDHYWKYATQNDTEIYSDNPLSLNTPNDTSVANFFADDSVANGYDDGYAATGSNTIDSVSSYLTDVGTYDSATSYYGTYDQSGNLWEILEDRTSSDIFRFRGGSWIGTQGAAASDASGTAGTSATTSWDRGFRVAARVPEPSALVLCVLGGFALALQTRRRRV